MSLVQKPEKLSSVCAAGALRDGVCAYTALHTHARVAAGNTILVFDGASVCKMTVSLLQYVLLESFTKVSLIMLPYLPLLTAFWPYVYPVGLLPWSKGFDHITLSTKANIPGTTSTHCWYGFLQQLFLALL